MLWAISNGARIKPTPDTKAACPICKSELISKCGSIKKWHWSHKNLQDCDDWSEGETDWHIDWKNEFKDDWQEVAIKNHRADIYNPHKMLVIELQNSTISADEIIEREQFYGNMIWVINGDTLGKNIILNYNKDKGIITFRWKFPPKSWWAADKPIYVDFTDCNEKLVDELNSYLIDGKKYYENVSSLEENDYGDGEHWETYAEDFTQNRINKLNKTIDLRIGNLILLKKIHHKTPCYGWATKISKEDFIKQYGS